MIRPLILVQIDPFGDKIGGIKTFIRDFVQFAPADFAIEIVGCTSDVTARPVGRWQSLEIGGRQVDFLPVLAAPDVHRRPRVPLSVKFTAAAVASRSAHRWSGRVLQFHFPGVSTPFLGVRSPKILVVHLNPADIDRGGGESRWSRIPGVLHRLEGLTLPSIDRIFVVNRAGVDFYRARHPRVADRVSFLPTSVDQALFQPLAVVDREAAREELVRSLGPGVVASDRFVLFAGRLEQQKDPVLLVETLAAVLGTEPGLRLLIVGEGALRGAMEARAAELGVAHRVHWLGFQPRAMLPRLMNAVDALLLTSRFEGMPITVLEALACGLPVVAPPVGEIPLVVADGKSGELARGRSPEELGAALMTVLAAGRDRYEAGAVAAVAPYRPERAMAPFFEAHREVMAGR